MEAYVKNIQDDIKYAVSVLKAINSIPRLKLIKIRKKCFHCLCYFIH